MEQSHTLPAMFFDDHVSRGLPGGTEVRRTRRTVTVVLSDYERDELLSDARHYASDQGWDASLRGLRMSARATVAAIAKAAEIEKSAVAQ